MYRLYPARPGDNLFFTLSGQDGILQSPCYGSNSLYFTNTQLGIGNNDQICAEHTGLDGLASFSVEDEPDIYRSSGANANWFLQGNSQLGIGDEIQVGCLHIGYDGKSYFCRSDESGIFQSTGDGTNASFLTAAKLGVPGSTIDGFAILPETVSPEITITNPIDGAFLNTTTPNITVTFQDTGSGIDTATFYAEINGTDMTSAFVATDTGATYQVPSTSPLPVGDNSLTVKIQDHVGNEAVATSNFTLGILRAIPGANPTSGTAPLTVYFTTDGEDPAGTIQRFRWDFDGNGSYDTYDEMARDYNRIYNTPGTYNATLFVQSSTGETATASITITVENNPPVATADLQPSNGEAPLTVQMTGSGSDSDGSIVLYEWDFDGDGTYDWSSETTGSTSHTYSTGGTHVASFRVTDATDLTGIDQILITVNIQTSLSVARDTIGFPDDSGMSASASSQYSSSYAPSRAIDGNTSTRWQTARYYTPYYGRNTWFEILFDTPQMLNGFTVRWYSSSYRMSRARIDVYNDTGSIIYSQETDLDGNVSQVSLPSLENATRLRLTAIASANIYYIIINEFEVDSTPMPGSQAEPTGTSINTSISAGTSVSILIKDSDGNTVRTLVNNQYRDMGSYSDYWDCKDDNGIVVNDGVHYAILQYMVDGQVQTYDLTNSTGGSRFNPPRQSTGGSYYNPALSKPFEDEFLPVYFSLNRAAEVTLFVGVLQTNLRMKTIYNRLPMPAGSHTAYWDGLDDGENIAQTPPGQSLILGIWGYTLADNAIFMTGGKPEVSQLSAEPNYYSPFSEKCYSQGNSEGVLLTYDVSENVSSVELRVYSLETGNLIRSALQLNVLAGENTFFWDGKNNDGEYPDIGDYQVGLIARDAEGNESMLNYTLVRIDY